MEEPPAPPEAQTEPSWVRDQGDVFMVVSYQNGRISLRKAGFKKIVHRNVPLTKCDEILSE